METKEIIKWLNDEMGDGSTGFPTVHRDLLVQTVIRLEELHAAQQWRPIEEAEKDGRRYLVWRKDIEATDFGRWEDGAWFNDEFERVDVTHFKPLPLPPAPQGGEG